jgi:hypothetical protein
MSINKKRGSIALARSLCYEIAGATSEDDISGSDYGSVDIAEILSAEVEWLREALAQPEQEPVAVDQAIMELAESVGLIGPASRTHDLHDAIQRFYDLICANATIKAAVAFSRTLEAKDEPVAWGVFEGNLHDMFFSQEEAQEMADLKGTHAEVRPLYTTPTQRTWVGLTYDEETELIRLAHNHAGIRFYIQAAEAKLKEKNT